jgi:hypothetical protein
MIMGWLRTRPVLCVGVSALDWRHRMLLRWLFDQRPPPVGSLAVLAAGQLEDEIWEKRGAGLPGAGHFAVIREAAGDADHGAAGGDAMSGEASGRSSTRSRGRSRIARATGGASTGARRSGTSWRA